MAYEKRREAPRSALSKSQRPKCGPAEQMKTFGFADGPSAQAKVWKVPILLLGSRRGEAFSVEVETGSTPLVLSVLDSWSPWR